MSLQQARALLQDDLVSRAALAPAAHRIAEVPVALVDARLAARVVVEHVEFNCLRELAEHCSQDDQAEHRTELNSHRRHRRRRRPFQRESTIVHLFLDLSTVNSK